MSNFSVSAAGREMIERYEGLRLLSYQDLVGVWTIGYGHTGPEIGPYMKWTKEQADAALTSRLEHEFGATVNKLCASAPTTQGQFDAMVSLAYNIGTGGFARSSILRHHLASEYEAAADAFMLYDHAGGREIEALEKRRQEEGDMYWDGSPE